MNEAIKNKKAIKNNKYYNIKNNIINYNYNKKAIYYYNIIDDNLLILLSMQHLYARIEFNKSYTNYKYFYYPKNIYSRFNKLREENK